MGLSALASRESLVVSLAPNEHVQAPLRIESEVLAANQVRQNPEAKFTWIGLLSHVYPKTTHATLLNVSSSLRRSRSLLSRSNRASSSA